MRFAVILAFLIGLAGLSDPAQAHGSDGSQAVSACAKDSMKQLVLFDKLISQKDFYGSSSKPLSNVVIFKGNLLGSKAQYKCVYTYGTGKTVITPYNGSSDNKPSAPVSWDEVHRVCLKTAQKENLSVDKVLDKNDQRNARNEVIARTLTLRVYNRGMPMIMDCRYDVFTGKAQLTR